jgi:MobA/MobL family
VVHFYMRRDVYKSGGQHAVDRVAYITRESVRGRAGDQLAYVSGAREDCLASASLNLPAWCAHDPYTYFAAAEKHEGVGWVAFEELKIGLPVELTHEQNIALIRDLVDTIAGERLPLTYAFHAPRTMDDTQEQPHVHVIFSRRQTDDAFARSAAQHFRKYNAAHPAQGGAQKDPFFAERLVQRHLRVMLADVINLHLEQHGTSVRVDPRSLSARGIDRAPEPKLFPKESREYREQRKVSETMAKVLDIRQLRASQPPREQNNARQYWESRKAFLGITRDMPHEQKLAHILLKRHGKAERVPARYRALLQSQPSRVQRRERIGQVQRLTRVLVAQLEDTRAQGKLRVWLHEPERDQGIGI